MLHESCDIVSDGGGWTCRTCRARWVTANEPATCAEDWPPVGHARSVLIVLVFASALCVLAFLGAFLGPVLREIGRAGGGS